MPNNKQTKGFLSKIRLMGAAGVDHPAHEHEGWLVMKSAASDLKKEVSMDPELEKQLTTLLETAERFSDQHTNLIKALADAEDYLDEAPENVKASAVSIYKYLHAIETAEEPVDEVDAEVTKSEATDDSEKRAGLMARIATFLAKGREAAPAATVDAEPAVEPKVDEAPDSTTVEKSTEVDWTGFLSEVKTEISKQLREEDNTDGAN